MNNLPFILMGVPFFLVIDGLIYFSWLIKKSNESSATIQTAPAAGGDDKKDQSAGAAAPTGKNSNWGWNLLLTAVAIAVLAVVIAGLAVFNDSYPDFFKPITEFFGENLKPTIGLAICFAVLWLAVRIDCSKKGNTK